MRSLSLSLSSLLLGSFLGGGIGYHVKTTRGDSLELIPKTDYFIFDESFSEVESAKALLAGLSRRFSTEFHVKRCLDMQACRLKTGSSLSVGTPTLEASILTLERGIEEFRGTGQEQSLTGDLLKILKTGRFYDRWLTTYLGALYSHPTDALVSSSAAEAMQIGNIVGR
jgi:hypothetical protein